MRRLLSTVVFVVGLVALTAVVIWLVSAERGPEAAQGRPPFVLPVTLAAVERGRLEPCVSLTGSVESSEHAQVGFRIGGRIEALQARAGDRVEAGAVLARLEDDDQRVALARAEAALALARQQLALAEAGSREEEVLRLAADLAQRQAEAELAESEVERNRPLLGTQVITQSRFDALVAAAKAADARVVAAEQSLAEARAGQRPEEIAIQRAEVDLRAAEVSIARNDLEKMTLRAPFGASVVEKLGSLGETVAAGAPIYDLVDLSRREVTLEVPSAYAAQVDAGAPVRLSLDELPDFELRAAISALVVSADERSRNFRAVVRLDPEADPALVLKPGMFVRALVELAALEEALLVPEDALRVVESGMVVVRAVSAPPAGEGQGPALAAEWVPVRLLATADGRSAVQVLAGELAAGDRVVVTGVDLAVHGVPLLPAGARPAAEGATQEAR